MLLRYGPFALIWILGLPFLLWVMTAPRVADPRYWQVDVVDIKLGSGQITSASDADQKSLSDAARNPSKAIQQKMADDPGLTPPPALPSDGIKINAISLDLLEDSTTHGSVPKISADGRAPWQFYDRPFPLEDNRPRLAIIIKDMGLSAVGTKAAISVLPGTVTFAYSPYADDLAKVMQEARDNGHETLLEMPLEVPPGSTMDVGSETISTTQTSSVNQDNFIKLLSKTPGSVGVITTGGQRLVNNEAMLRPLMQNLMSRGLLMVDDTQQAETLSPLIAEQLKSPWARSLFTLDAVMSQEALDLAMGKAVQMARQNGRAVVVASSSPLARATIANWVRRLEREGVALAPISAVVTLGSAQSNVAPPPAAAAPTEPPPGVMQAPAQDAMPTVTPPPPTPEENAAANGPVNLLRPGSNTIMQSGPPAIPPIGGPAPNILDPSKPAH